MQSTTHSVSHIAYPDDTAAAATGDDASESTTADLRQGQLVHSLAQTGRADMDKQVESSSGETVHTDSGSGTGVQQENDRYLNGPKLLLIVLSVSRFLCS